MVIEKLAAVLFAATLFSACTRPAEQANSVPAPVATQAAEIAQATPAEPPASPIPNLQTEILDDRNKQTSSPLGTFDFKNYTYKLPRGWQNPDSDEITLTNGRIEPVAVDTDLGMDPDELAERKSRRRIGMSYVATKYFDVTGDGTVQFLYPGEKDAEAEMPTNFDLDLSVVAPFGTDLLVAVTSETPMPELVEFLKQNDRRRTAGNIARRLGDVLPEGARVGFTVLYTSAGAKL